MPSDIFLSQRGVVSAIDTDLGPTATLFLEGWQGFVGFKSIITSMTVFESGGVQFMHTLRDFIYVYVFGERIGRMKIGGLSFWNACDGGGFHGLEYVNQYYLLNRVSTRATPVTLVFGGGTAFFGFLTNMTISLPDPENLIGQFELDFHVVPEQNTISQVIDAEEEDQPLEQPAPEQAAPNEGVGAIAGPA